IRIFGGDDQHAEQIRAVLQQNSHTARQHVNQGWIAGPHYGMLQVLRAAQSSFDDIVAVVLAGANRLETMRNNRPFLVEAANGSYITGQEVKGQEEYEFE